MRSDVPPGFGARPEDASGQVREFVEPRALHPISVVLGIPIVQLIQALLFPAAAVLATGGSLTLGILGLVVVVGTVARVLSWQRFRWSFDGRVLRVSSGVLSRTNRSIDVGRIQQVEVDRSFVHRLARVAAVRIETAGSSSEPGVELRVLAEADAIALRDAVRASTVPVGDTAPEGTELLRVPLHHVALAAVTGAQLLVLPAVIGAGLQFVGGRLGEIVGRASELLRSFVDGDAPSAAAAIATAIGVLVVVSAVVAVVAGLVRDGRFRIERLGDDLVVKRGLLGTRDSTVPLGRIQLVHVARNPVRRLLGVATVRLHSATADGERRVTVPLLRDGAVDGFLLEVLGVDRLPQLSPHPLTARRRSLWRWLRRATVFAAAGWVAHTLAPFSVDLGRVAWFALPPLVIGAALLAVVEWRALGHGIDDRLVASRRGALVLTTSVSPVGKIQAVSTRTNPFQRRLGLESITAHVAGPGGDLDVLDAGTEQARTLHARLVVTAAGARVGE